MKRDKNIKITSTTHELLKNYCEENGLKMFSFVEKLIREGCKEKSVTTKPKKDLYEEG
jgi:ferritin